MFEEGHARAPNFGALTDYAARSAEACIQRKALHHDFSTLQSRSFGREFEAVAELLRWLPNLLPDHAERLQQLLDDPEG